MTRPIPNEATLLALALAAGLVACFLTSEPAQSPPATGFTIAQADPADEGDKDTEDKDTEDKDTEDKDTEDKDAEPDDDDEGDEELA